MFIRTLALSIASLVLIALTLAVIPHAAALPGADNLQEVKKAKLDQITKRTEEFGAAWNKHDAKAIAALWVSDGDLIDPWGVTSVGRSAVEKFFEQEHTGAGKLAKSHWEIKSRSTRLITGDIALDDWQVILTGLEKDGASMPPQIHRVVIVWKLEGSKWEIAAARPGMPTPVEDEVAPKAPGKGTMTPPKPTK